MKVNSSFQWNETRRVGSSNTRATVLDWLVRDGEFAEIVANHLGLDFNLDNDENKVQMFIKIRS